jgi:hypothetical protein
MISVGYGAADFEHAGVVAVARKGISISARHAAGQHVPNRGWMPLELTGNSRHGRAGPAHGDDLALSPW